MSTVFLNGKWLPLEEAHISVLDRGFIFGDGVYEVIPVYNRHPYRMKQHIARLQYSMNGIRLTNPYTPEEWESLVQQLIAQHESIDQAIYLHVTRGVAPRNHDFPANTPPTVFMMSNPLKRPSKELVEKGWRAVSLEDQRWAHCDYKTISLLGNVLATQYGTDHGCGVTIQFRDGLLTEGGASNILVVRNNAVFSPKKNQRILHGITLDAVSEAVQRAGIAFHYDDITESEVRSADELWMSSSTKEMIAITHLDDQPIGTGHVGKLYPRVYAELQKDIDETAHQH